MRNSESHLIRHCRRLSRCWAQPLRADEPTRAQLDFFEKKIRPVLVKHCYECHSEKSDELGGNLRVDLREGLIKGGETGTAVVPGQPDESLLISSLEYQDYEMPPDGKLPDEVIADFRRWVKMGAPDPRDGKMEMASQGKETPARQSENLWSLQPVRNPEPPQVRKPMASNDVDRFILQHLEQTQSQTGRGCRNR